MNERLKESLSALMDGEVDELELGRLLKQAEGDPQVLAAWSRYHLVSGLMKREPLMPASERLVARLHQALKDEADLFEPSSEVRWLKPVASVAVTVAVTFAVVLGYQVFSAPGLSPLGNPLGKESRPEVVVSPTSVIGIPTVNGNVNAPLSDRRRLDAYMLHHAQYRALNERPGVIPIAKVATFDIQ